MELTCKMANICKKKFEIIRSSGPHNPEVVGSSPASATIKNTGFRKKPGVFLISRAEMSTPKTGVELALELAAENAKMENRKNPTFSGKLGFLRLQDNQNLWGKYVTCEDASEQRVKEIGSILLPFFL